MIPQVLLIGAALWAFRNRDRTETPSETPDDQEPAGPPVDGDADGDGIVEFEELTVWSAEATVGDDVVWSYTTGILREDGSEVFDQPFIVIGDAAHHNFLRQSAAGGSIDIPKERTGGSTDQDNVIVFASVDAAVEYLSEEPDEDDGTGPQKQPEDDDDDLTPPPSWPPTMPGFGGGLGGFTGAI